ncbi:MAG: molybdopterin-dependent oxidoreductase [Dehalococcoidia bacterium]
MTRSRVVDAVAGLLAAAVALAAGEAASALIGGPSPVVAVGDVVVDYAPGGLVKAAIELLGTRDKPALLIGVTLTSLAIGMLLGPVAGRDRRVGVAAFVAFGLVGALAGARDPLSADAIAVAAAAALAGVVTLSLLLSAASPKGTGVRASMPGPGVADRRRFLLFAAGAAGAAVAGVAGRTLLGPSVDVEEERAAIRLPRMADRFRGVRGLAVNGVSSVITPNDDFYRIDTALVVPRVAVESWRLSVTGMVDRPYEVSFADLVGMASVEQSLTLACVSNEVGGDLVGNAIWLGVPLAEILERAGVQEGATQIVGRSVDGFTAGFPTEIAFDGRPAIVAIGMNGEPLPAIHGFPARLVVPGLYGYVSATKWIREIELTTLEAFDAYWIPRGWSKEAPVKTQSRIDVPRDGRTVDMGRVAVAGVAWAGVRELSRVEVRINATGEETDEWHEARLGEPLSQSSWRQWVYEWDAAPGEYRIEVRATDGDGATQTHEQRPPAPDGATGHHAVRVNVRRT